MDIGTIIEIKKDDDRIECRVDFGADMIEDAYLYNAAGQFEYPMINDEVAVQIASDSDDDSGAENIIVAVFRPSPDGIEAGETIHYSRDGDGAVVASTTHKADGTINIDADDTINVSADADINLTASGNVNVSGATIVLNNGDDVALKADALNTWLTTKLSVATAFGPSGPSVIALTPAVKNSTVKL